ncbi:MAG: DUF2071 domain-containing protein [Pirellulales bacterium]
MSSTLVDCQPVAKTASVVRCERPFLTAQWRHLAMLNYEIDAAVLAPYVPAGTELDRWNGITYASMVGFLFIDTRVRGWAIPFHRNFEEVNLRFYVRRRAPEGWRRGVVFIRELVRLPAIAAIARWCYQENYRTARMWHRVHASDGHAEAHYAWRLAGREHSLGVTAVGPMQTLRAGTLEEFIAEHYWGYSAQRDGSTKEYRVAHPSWRVRTATTAHFDCDVAKLYGPQFAEFFTPEPQSAFLAEGSAVELFRGRKIAPGG